MENEISFEQAEISTQKFLIGLGIASAIMEMKIIIISYSRIFSVSII